MSGSVDIAVHLKGVFVIDFDDSCAASQERTTGTKDGSLRPQTPHRPNPDRRAATRSGDSAPNQVPTTPDPVRPQEASPDDVSALTCEDRT
jgi:hypothetical protein